MKEINLREILEKHDKVFFEDSSDSTDTSIQIDDVLSAMKEACEATVDLCAKNAIIDMKKRSQYGKYRKWQNTKEGEDVDLFSYEVKYLVDKESIIKVKQLII